MENYIDQKFDKAALKHLKFQILEKIKNDIGKMNTNVKKKGIQSNNFSKRTFYDQIIFE